MLDAKRVIITKMKLYCNYILISAIAVVRFFDSNSGKVVGDVMRLPLDLVEIALNPLGAVTDQKLVFIDSNGDLFITPINV